MPSMVSRRIPTFESPRSRARASGSRRRRTADAPAVREGRLELQDVLLQEVPAPSNSGPACGGDTCVAQESRQHEGGNTCCRQSGDPTKRFRPPGSGWSRRRRDGGTSGVARSCSRLRNGTRRRTKCCVSLVGRIEFSTGTDVVDMVKSATRDDSTVPK